MANNVLKLKIDPNGVMFRLPSKMVNNMTTNHIWVSKVTSRKTGIFL